LEICHHPPPGENISRWYLRGKYQGAREKEGKLERKRYKEGKMYGKLEIIRVKVNAKETKN
jgi:hypothetical protein